MNKLKEAFVTLHEMAVAKAYEPRVVTVAVKLPSGAIEVITNTEDTLNKMTYYMSAYDDEFKLKTNADIQIVGCMVV